MNPLPTVGQNSSALLDLHEVAAFLNISAATIRRLAERGAMPQPVRLGRAVRWKREDLLSWVAAGCSPCTREKERP